jgi:Ca-activated chloride channel family protein
MREPMRVTGYGLLITMTVVSLTMVGCAAEWRWVDLWLSADQQGRYYFEKGDYEEAAERFEDPLWKGIACYHEEDWDCAIDQFARLDTAEAYFNLGNAYAHSQNHVLAVTAYDQALERRPGWPEASENRQLVSALIPKEPEAPEDAPPGDPSFAPDEIRFDEKGEKGEKGDVDQAFFSDEQIAEMWLRGVQSTPADFLRMKFAFQVAESERREP